MSAVPEGKAGVRREARGGGGGGVDWVQHRPTDGFLQERVGSARGKERRKHSGAAGGAWYFMAGDVRCGSVYKV